MRSNTCQPNLLRDCAFAWIRGEVAGVGDRLQSFGPVQINARSPNILHAASIAATASGGMPAACCRNRSRSAGFQQRAQQLVSDGDAGLDIAATSIACHHKLHRRKPNSSQSTPRVSARGVL